MNTTLYNIGRFLQLLGMLILPAGIAGNLARPELVGVRGTLFIAAGGMVLFGLGWIIQQAAGRP